MEEDEDVWMHARVCLGMEGYVYVVHTYLEAVLFAHHRMLYMHVCVYICVLHT